VTILKNFLRNLILLAVLGVVIYLVAPEMVSGAAEAYWTILGPIGILLIIVFAIPKKKKR